MWYPLTASPQEAHVVSFSHCPCQEWLNIIFEGHPFLDPPPVILEEGLLWCSACGDPVNPRPQWPISGLRVAQSM